MKSFRGGDTAAAWELGAPHMSADRPISGSIFPAVVPPPPQPPPPALNGLLAAAGLTDMPPKGLLATGGFVGLGARPPNGLLGPAGAGADAANGFAANGLLLAGGGAGGATVAGGPKGENASRALCTPVIGS